MKAIVVEKSMLDAFEEVITKEALDRIQAEDNTITLGLLSDENEAIGALSGFLVEDTFYIDSIVVLPDWRRKGGGSLLVNLLTSSLSGEEIIVCAEFMTDNIETDEVASFLEAVGFDADEDLRGVFFADAKDISQNELFTDANNIRNEENIRSLSEIDDSQLEKLVSFARENYLPLPEDGLRGESVDKEISSVHVNRLGQVDAYLLMDHSIDCMTTLAALYDGGDAKALIGMIRKSMKTILLKHPMGTTIAFNLVNEDSAKLMRKICPQSKQMSYKYFILPR